MWNGSRKLEGLLGVFTRPGFLEVGTAEEPCPYVSSSKPPDRDAFKGRQFGVAATKTGKMPKDLFDGQCKPLFEGDTFVDSLPYRELQPEKPPAGFQTSDYSKRDEFSLTIRQEQHRQQLKHELRVQKLAQQRLEARRPAAVSTGAAASNAGLGNKKQAPLLFDLVFEGEADLCIMAKRDTRNPTALSKERQVGPYKTTSLLAQQALAAASSAAGIPAASLAKVHSGRVAASGST